MASSSVHDILDRSREDEASPGAFGHFTLGAGTPADPAMVGGDGAWSLYCLDVGRREALFLELPPGVDLSAAAFVYSAQFAAARRAFVAPFEALEAIAAAAPRPERLVFLFNIGRCGSTLVSRMLARVPGVWSLSEPSAFYDLAMARARLGDAETDQLVEAAVRLCYCPPPGRDAPTFALKFHSQALFQAAAYRRAYPDAAFALIVREPEGWAQSFYRFIAALGMNVAPAPWAVQAEQWNILAAAAPSDRLAAVVDLADPVHLEEILAVAWALHMEAYRSACDAGGPFHVLDYAELSRDPEAATARLLGACGLPPEAAAAALGALAEDAQAGTPGARDRSAAGFTTAQRERLHAALARSGASGPFGKLVPVQTADRGPNLRPPVP